jgi:hypothetical protein
VGGFGFSGGCGLVNRGGGKGGRDVWATFWGEVL